MAMIAHMRAAFVKCGLNNATANYVITDQGFDNSYDLLMASKESVDNMVKNAIESAPADAVFSLSLLEG